MQNIVGEMSESEPTRIGWNVETMIDNFTGTYHVGLYDERINSGGMYSSVVVTGRGNTLKTTTGLLFLGRLMERYVSTTSSLDDNEESLQGIERMAHLLQHVAPTLVANRDLYNISKFKVRNGSSEKETSTIKWFDRIQALLNARAKKNTKEDRVVTPFLDPMDKSGKNFIVRLNLFVAFIDSLSKATIDVTQELINKSATDHSDQNIVTARESLIKTRIVREIPRLSAVGGSAWIMTAHMGDKLNFNPLETPQSKLAFMNARVTLKNAPEQVTFLSTYVLYSNHLRPLMEKKEPLYPANDSEFDFGIQLERDVDLMELHMMTLRSKVGLTGVEWAYVVSQTDGYDIPLSHFHFLKKYSFGFDGLGGQWINLWLLPDMKLSRTTIRGKVSDTKLIRALEITVAIMIKIICGDREVKEGFKKVGGTLQGLYEAVKEKGYDWEEIYTTRDFWTEDHYTNPVRYLSALDIIRMGTGEYVPYWKQKDFDEKKHKG